MKKTGILLLILIALAGIGNSIRGADTGRFDTIVAQLSNAGCVYFEFITTIESDIFKSIDTAGGKAFLAGNGKFHITIGDDEYINDGQFLYSYSKENNQVTIEQPPDSETAAGEMLFLTRLDELYMVAVVKPDNEYHLFRKNNVADNNDIPDSLVVFLSKDVSRISRVVFYDINEDLNTIQILSQQLSNSCPDSVFIPVFPDSVERVKL